jgi:hypothetical protein
MGISDKFDELKDKAVDAVGGDDKAKEGVDKAADAVDDATGGKASKHIDKGADKAKEEIDEWSDPKQAG